ncbi:MAG: CRISPR-associated protein Csx3 [Clostridia bacterium]
MEKEIVNIIELGKSIGMEEKEQTLPNGKMVKSLVWDSENLIKAVDAVKHLSEKGNPVVFDGPSPAWLVTALSHAVHPCKTSIHVPQIGKDVDIVSAPHGEVNKEAEINFNVKESDDSVVIEYNLDDPVYDEDNLSKLVVPEVSEGKAVYISGRGPNYITATVAEAYSHTNSSVSLFQPGVGYTCAITHSRKKRLGTLDKEPITKDEIVKDIVASKDAQKKDETQIDER